MVIAGLIVLMFKRDAKVHRRQDFPASQPRIEFELPNEIPQQVSDDAPDVAEMEVFERLEGAVAVGSVELYVRKRETATRAAQVRGRHFTEWRGELNRLKRENRLDEALELVLECIDATEREDAIMGWGIPPGWTRHAAIIYRKKKDLAGERQILERFIRNTSDTVAHDHPLVEGLAKVKMLRQKAEQQKCRT